VKEIDFLPSEYWKRRASQRDQWYLMGIGVALLVLLLGSIVHESRQAASVSAQLSSVETEYKDVLGQLAAVQRLEESRTPLAFDALFYSLIRAHPSFSRALVAIATSCPPNLTLNTIRIKPGRSASIDPKTLGASTRQPAEGAGTLASDLLVEKLQRFASDREYTQFSLDIVGVAESDLEVAELIERLEKAACFTEVQLGSSGDKPAGVSELREFVIQCRLAKVL
jgi:Tfp pilus assembly protein PilN